MNRSHLSDDLGTLVEDARALVTATADVANEKVADARKRLSAALENGKDTYERVRGQAVHRAQAADEVVREHPYQILGLAFAMGAVFGALVARRCSRSGG